MKVKMILAAVVAVVAAGSVGSLADVNAQEYQTQQTQQIQPRIDPQVATPKLGVHAIDAYGHVEVTSVFFNTPAQRLGLEAGDRIVSINGRQIRSLFDLKRALQHAAGFRNGQIRVLVDNVRARQGQSVQRYVSVATYLNGFAQQSTPIPVPTYNTYQE